MSPLLRENSRTPVAYVGDVNSLFWNFISFPRKPGYSASFLHWVFSLSYPYLTTLFILNSIRSWSPKPSPLGNPWLHRGWTPACHHVVCCCSVAKLCPSLCDPVDCSTQVPLSFTVSRSLFRLMSVLFIHLWLFIQHSQWCYLTISSSTLPFSFCFQSFPASGSFPINQLFTSGGQSIGASASVLPKNIQGWFPFGLTGVISL